MTKPITRKLRCAIYTRKSTEEGLEQEFNSLHAQREACEAYIASQRSEGWALIREPYDDGGFSGGTLERPALKRLLADIEEGLTPDGALWAPRPRVHNAMVKALARAFRWRRMLDEGVHATLEDPARAKGVNATYVSRVLRLTLLAPEIVEAILDGRQPAGLLLNDLLDGFSVAWDGQFKL